MAKACTFNPHTNSFDCEGVIDNEKKRPQFSCDKEWPDAPKLTYRNLDDIPWLKKDGTHD